MNCLKLPFKAWRKCGNDRERRFNDPPQFYDWFITYCKDIVKNTMLKSHRIAAGLGNPPQPYYTNDVESMNNVIKHQTSFKVQELPQFVESMKKMIDCQKREIEKAIIGMGEYRVSPEFRNLAVDARLFFQKTVKQREKVIHTFFSATLKQQQSSDNIQNVSEEQVDDDYNPLLSLPSLPEYVANKIWKESQQLQSEDNSVCASPGCSDGKAWLVRSTNPTHKQPYFVECKENGDISCEQSCMLYHSSKLCAHIVVVADHKILS